MLQNIYVLVISGETMCDYLGAVSHTPSPSVFDYISAEAGK